MLALAPFGAGGCAVNRQRWSCSRRRAGAAAELAARLPRRAGARAALFRVECGAVLHLGRRWSRLGLLRRRFAPVAAALGAACLINLAPYYGYETKPRWDLVAERPRRFRPGPATSSCSTAIIRVWCCRFLRPERVLTSIGIILTWRMPEAIKLASGHIFGRSMAGSGRPRRNGARRPISQRACRLGPARQRKVGRALHRPVALPSERTPSPKTRGPGMRPRGRGVQQHPTSPDHVPPQPPGLT